MPAFDAKWYNLKGDAIAESIMGIANHIEQNQSDRFNKNLRHMRLYGNVDIAGLSPQLYAMPNAPFNSTGQPEGVRLNIIHSMVSTLASKITKNKPKPSFLTLGGEWGDRKKAKQLEKFTDGIFYQSDIYKIAPYVFIDSLVFDIGVLKVFDCESKVKCERVFPNEILVDDADGMYNNPRNIYQVKYIPAETLAAQYPKHEFQIMSVAQKSYEEKPELVSYVKVIESWHLKSGTDTKDGKHAICIEGATLFVEPYEYESFPFVFLKWTDRLLGFYGQGLAEQLRGIQLEINKILKTIQNQVHLGSRLRVFLEAGSKINKSHLNNQDGAIVEYTGTPPQIVTPSVIPGDLFNHLQWLIQEAYQISGISQLSAQSQKPAGLNSGAALREYADNETIRFLLKEKEYEQFFLTAAEKMIECAKTIAENDGDYEVKVADKKYAQKINWKEIDLERDSYVMQMFPINFLPSTPAGKLETIKEMFEAGLLTSREEAAMLLDFPDTDKMFSMATAPIELIDMAIEKMLDADEPEYIPPDPYGNLELSKERAQRAYAVAKTEGAYEENLELLSRYILECLSLMQQAQPQQQPQQPTPPTGMPTGAPAPQGPMPV